MVAGTYAVSWILLSTTVLTLGLGLVRVLPKSSLQTSLVGTGRADQAPDVLPLCARVRQLLLADFDDPVIMAGGVWSTLGKKEDMESVYKLHEKPSSVNSL